MAIRRNWPLAAKLPWYWQRIACAIVGIRVRVDGEPAAPPLLIAANHISWLDISVLGSVLPVSFVAKAEVAGWPVVGTLARLQRTVFIDRDPPYRRPASATEAIAARVGRGDVMVLFAEGTTGDGNRSCPSGARSSAPPRAAVRLRADHGPAGRDHLCRHPRRPRRAGRPPDDRLVRRHGARPAIF